MKFTECAATATTGWVTVTHYSVGSGLYNLYNNNKFIFFCKAAVVGSQFWQCYVIRFNVGVLFFAVVVNGSSILGFFICWQAPVNNRYFVPLFYIYGRKSSAIGAIKVGNEFSIVPITFCVVILINRNRCLGVEHGNKP